MHKLNSIYKETNGKLGLFLKLYRLMKQKGMSIEQVVNAVEIAANKLPYMESLYRQIKDEVNKLHYTRQGLVNDIEAKKNKISILDTTAFSCEQESKRKEKQVQALADKKDRIEKWIVNVSNNYELKQIVKENVKAILSENKQIISVALTALLQTLKSDPKMVNIIYKILAVNDSEQHEDDNDNVTKYLESNKDSLVYLAEKNYENFVEDLTNDSIANASSNATLSSPRSSSTLPNLSNQNDR